MSLKKPDLAGWDIIRDGEGYLILNKVSKLVLRPGRALVVIEFLKAAIGWIDEQAKLVKR